MTPAEFRTILTTLGLTEHQAADLLGVTVSTVARWKAGRRRIPEPAIRLLGALQAGGSVREYLEQQAAKNSSGHLG